MSNLDAKLRVQMRTTVSRLQNQLDTTTVYVTHDQVEAMTLGDRVAVMRGDVTVPADLAVKVQRAGAGRNLIVGIRPEDFEDAALMDGRRAEGLTFPADVDVLESLGAEKYAYFHLAGPRATARELEELADDAGAKDAPGGADQVVARLDAASRAREGQRVQLWFDPHKLHLFNPDNGAHLTL